VIGLCLVYVAYFGAWGMGTMATASDVLREGMAAAWNALPTPVAALFWIPFASAFLIGATALAFFTVFPKPLLRRVWVRALLWMPAAFFSRAFARQAEDRPASPSALLADLRNALASRGLRA
jgi:hypothetical protein